MFTNKFRNNHGDEVLQFEADDNYYNSLYIFATLKEHRIAFAHDADQASSDPEFICSTRAFQRVVDHMLEGGSLRVADATFASLSPERVRFTAGCGDKFFVSAETMRAILLFSIYADDLVVIV